MSGKGSAALERHRQGKKLTPMNAILAKCAECMVDYIDGRVDCGVTGCPLHPFQPYQVRDVAQNPRAAVTPPEIACTELPSAQTGKEFGVPCG
jgi:hypothetical protein